MAPRRLAMPGSRVTPLRRRPAVEQAVRGARVLGQVDAAALRVDREGLVGVAAERLDGLGDRLAVGEDLEGVAVVARVDPAGAVLAGPGGAALGLGLLAGQPAAPGGRAAGAVGQRAGDADPLPQVATPVVGLDHRAPAAVERRRVVDGALDVRHAQRRAGRQLVVLDQPQPVTLRVEHRGPVVVRGGGGAVAELGLPGVGHHLVGEARRQREQPVRVVDQRREGALAAARRGTGPRRPGLGEGRHGARRRRGRRWRRFRSGCCGGRCSWALQGLGEVAARATLSQTGEPESAQR